MSRGRRLVFALISILLATAIWLPVVHLFFRPPQAQPQATSLLARQLDLFHDAAAHAGESKRMRKTNAEWDFMGRTYLAWSLAEQALRDPTEREQRLKELDSIIDDTMRAEETEGLYYFLMPYAQRGSWVVEPARSEFTDGEIALMLALRRLVSEKAAYRAPLQRRVDSMIEHMEKSPVLSGESYPDECWTFCNAVALAAIRASDIVDGTDHSAFIKRWVEVAKAKLVDPSTGLLISSYTQQGVVKDGPEGSSIWMVAHALRAVDPVFAEDQYRRAKSLLSKRILGFGFAREWPSHHEGTQGVDSGPIIPWLDVSAGSSGLAFVAAASFSDIEYLDALRSTLEFAAFPIEKSGRRYYAASNQVGDAVVLYALSIGAVWDAVRDGRHP
jgi:hypothetical protein